MNGVVSVMCVHDGKEHQPQDSRGRLERVRVLFETIFETVFAWRLCVAAGMTKPGCGLRRCRRTPCFMALLAPAALVVVPPI